MSFGTHKSHCPFPGRHRKCLVYSLFPFLAVLLSSSCALDEKPRPNVVLIVVDALRADHVEAERNGIPIMPNLTRLSKEAVVFTRATSSSSWTKPAMASIFTGLSPEIHQVYYSSISNDVPPRNRFMPEAFDLMAERLKGAGYATVCIQTNPHLTREMGFAQGFDHYQYLPLGPADKVTSEALKVLEELPSPFFLYVHYIDPHAPYSPPDTYQARFEDTSGMSEEELAMVTPTHLEEYIQDKIVFDAGWSKKRKYEPLSQKQKDVVKARYAGEARFVDDELAKLLGLLQTRKPSFLFMTADHGEELWERGSAGHGSTLYQEVLHVPLLVVGPGVEPREVQAPVQTLDILPTIADLLGLERDMLWQGRNLLDDNRPMERAVFASTHGSITFQNVFEEMVCWRGQKLIIDHPKAQNELYDLSNDPQELTNLATVNSQDVAYGLEMMEREHEEAKRYTPQLTVLEDFSGDRDKEKKTETEEQLKALGYL